MPPTLGYRPDIDGLRAIAVLAVVLFHAGVAGFGGGFVGVDAFFVISGFLITRLIVDDPHFSLLAFYQRRAGRILPALAVVVFATSVAAYIFSCRGVSCVQQKPRGDHAVLVEYPLLV